MIGGSSHHTSFFQKSSNWTSVPSASAVGVTVTSSATINTKGSYVASGLGVLANDVYGLTLMIRNSATSASNREILLDIATDPAGGTSYTPIISNLKAGKSGTFAVVSGVREFSFPYFIPAGSTVGFRSQASIASSPCTVGITVYSKPSAQELTLKGMKSQSVGALTATSLGTAFSPGNAVYGGWTLLGVTSSFLWWWQPSFDVNNATVTTEAAYVEFGWGDATTKYSIMKIMHLGTGTEVTSMFNNVHLLPQWAYCPVPSGSNIYVRGKCINGPDSGYNAVLAGIG